MKTSNFMRSIFAIASIISLAWPVSVMAQSEEASTSEDASTESAAAPTPQDELQAAWDQNTRDVVYSAGMKLEATDMASTSVYVFTADDIANHGWRTLAEMLRHVPGVQTLTQASQFQSVTLRGIAGMDNSNSGILWLQDGVPLNDAHTSGFDLDDTYPVERIKRLEIVMGPGAAIYGADAAQGVIHIFTKDAKDIDQYGEYHLSLQNNLTFKASAQAGYHNPEKGLDIIGHVTGNTTQGPGLIGNHVYNMYVMDQAGENVGNTLTPTYYRAENLYSNSDKAWTDVDFKFNYQGLKWNLGFKYRDSGLDGSEYNPLISVEAVSTQQKDPSSTDTPATANENLSDTCDPSTQGGICGILASKAQRFTRMQFYTDIAYETTIQKNIDLSAMLSYRLNAFEFFSKRYPSEETSQNESWGFASEFYTHQLYGNVHMNWRMAETNTLTAGIAYQFQAISDASDRASTDASVENNEIQMHTPSIYVMDEHRMWNDRMRLTAGLRFDAYHIGTDSDAYLPSAHVAFTGAWTDWMTTRLAYGFTPKSASVVWSQFKKNNTIHKDGLNTDAPVTQSSNTISYANSKQRDTGKSDPRYFDNATEEKHHRVELAFLFKPMPSMFLNFDVYYTHIDDPILMQMTQAQQYFGYGISNDYIPVTLTDASTDIVGFNIGLNTAIGKYWQLYAHYSFMYSNYIYPSEMEYTDKDSYATQIKSFETEYGIGDDRMHTAKLGATYLNDYLTADLAIFLVGGIAPRKSHYTWHNELAQQPFYAIFQPQISVKLPANLGLMVQGSYALSDGMTESPTYRYYYETEGVPVNRYSVMFTLMYPFRK